MISKYNIPAIQEWTLPKFLKGHILAAVPDMMDTTFKEALIFMIDHNDEGAFGCVFNHLSNSRLGDVIDLGDPETKAYPLYIGGPVQQNFLYVMHNSSNKFKSSEFAVGPVNGIYFEPEIATVLSYLKESGQNDSDFKFRFFAGYSGWGPDQLEKELTKSTWLSMPFDLSLLFTDDTGYESALRKKGGMYWIAAETGILPSRN